MNKGWLELESDPGLFTLLVEDFGVEGVQVEEIYDLQKSIEGPVYGFIFLFRWIEDRRSRRKLAQEEESLVMDDDIINSMFFARQMIQNSCATHALLSVLLNCDNQIKLGDTLTRLKQFTSAMTPEDKGYAIGNMPELARAHNSHARPEPYRAPEKQQGVSSTGRTLEAFHFVSYVPVNGRLFELDGLKPFPVDHGLGCEKEDWTETFRRVISERLGGEPYSDIRFNLMAVVPDRRILYEQKLATLKTNRRIVLEALQQMLKGDSANENSTSGGPIVTRAVAMAAREAVAEGATNGDAEELKVTKSDEAADGGTKSSDTTKKKSSRSSVSERSRSSQVLEDRASHSSGDLEDEAGKSRASRCSSLSPGGEGSSTDTASEADYPVTTPPAAGRASEELSAKSLSEETTVSPSVRRGVLMEVDEEPLISNYREDAKIDITLVTEEGGTVRGAEGSGTPRVADGSGEGGSSSGGGLEGGDMEATEADRRLKAAEPEGSRSDEKMEGMEVMAKGQAFTPKELLALLTNFAGEMSTYECLLKDEVEKRKKYKIDDCRRTHNYDQFIFTFLTMLAEQNQLAGLVEQHMLTKRRQGMPVGRLHRRSTASSGKSTVTSDPTKRRGRRKR